MATDGKGMPLCPTCGGLGYIEHVDSPVVPAALAFVDGASSHTATCAGCGQFLSNIRVEMGLARCSDCDVLGRKPRRKGRR